MSRALITLAGIQGVSLDISADALLLKNQALTDAASITAVNDGDSQQIATNVLSTIKLILKQLETSRTDIKRPVLDLGKMIDDKAKVFAKELDQEASRLHELIQSHYREEKRKADEARRMQEMLEAKRRAKAEAEARALEEERRRIEQAALKATSETEAARLDEEARQKAAQAEAAQAKAETVTAQVIKAPEKAEKMTVRKVWKHRVTNIQQLLQARPEFVSLEPRTAAINAEIRGGNHSIPGLEIWEEDDITIRS